MPEPQERLKRHRLTPLQLQDPKSQGGRGGEKRQGGEMRGAARNMRGASLPCHHVAEGDVVEEKCTALGTSLLGHH